MGGGLRFLAGFFKRQGFTGGTDEPVVVFDVLKYDRGQENGHGAEKDDSLPIGPGGDAGQGGRGFLRSPARNRGTKQTTVGWLCGWAIPRSSFIA